MRRALFILTFLTAMAIAIWFFQSSSVSPAARAARPYARQFAEKIQGDIRFSDVGIRVVDLGTKGPIFVAGEVQSEVDRAELRRIFDSLNCPERIVWMVGVATNRLEEVR